MPDPDTVARPITPKTADDLGDRMILTPLDTHPGIGDSDVRRFLSEQAKQHNVVVIVPSRRQAEYWRLHAAAVHDKTTIHAGHLHVVFNESGDIIHEEWTKNHP